MKSENTVSGTMFAPDPRLNVCDGEGLERGYGSYSAREGQRQMHDLKPTIGGTTGMLPGEIFMFGFHEKAWKYVIKGPRAIKLISCYGHKSSTHKFVILRDETRWLQISPLRYRKQGNTKDTCPCVKRMFIFTRTSVILFLEVKVNKLVHHNQCLVLSSVVIYTNNVLRSFRNLPSF